MNSTVMSRPDDWERKIKVETPMWADRALVHRAGNEISWKKMGDGTQTPVK